MPATPLKTAARHPLQFWWFWTAVAAVVALSATFATYFVLGAMIAWNMAPPDRSLGAGLFIISFFALFLTPTLFVLVTRRAIDPDGALAGTSVLDPDRTGTHVPPGIQPHRADEDPPTNARPAAPRGDSAMNAETLYALEPTAFRSMQEAQEITNQLEDNLTGQNLGAANVRPEVVEIFSELVNNAAEHGISNDRDDDAAAHAHVRFMPHRRGHAFDIVVADSGPGIRATLSRNPSLPEMESDRDAIGLAIQELVSGTGVPTRGIGLWMTVNEMKRTGRKLWLHSGAGLLAMYGASEPALREINPRQGVMVRLTIPA